LGVGVLVRNDRVSNATVETPLLSSAAFDLGPLVLRAKVTGPPTRLPQMLTVVVSQFAPRTNVDLNDATGAAARAKRQAQAEWLADYIQGEQINNPSAAILSLGGYDAFAFNDGYVDVVGTVRGLPASGDQLTNPSPDVVSPDLVDLDESNPAEERYTSLSNGSAQSLDHVLASSNLSAQFVALRHARVNADFPSAFKADATSPVRVSETDPVVAYFTFLPDVDAPVFSFTPEDRVVEATGPGGAAVSYEAPSANDDLDGAVAVTCSPASGSTFALGPNTVTCSTQDLAGNVNSLTFTVTVQDTTAPLLFLPPDIVSDASSASGGVVTFAAWATDAVTVAPVVTCTPVSGSTFPVGETTVSCDASDAAGNSAHGSFKVTITLPQTEANGRLHGAGEVAVGAQRAWFAFDVRQSDVGERGWVLLMLRSGGGRPDRFVSGSVSDVVVGADGVFSFTSTGSWNGQSGYRVEITAADRGEPGRGTDTFRVTVHAPNGGVVKAVSGVLENGNLQFGSSQTARVLGSAAGRTRLHRQRRGHSRAP
jgi:hypothetical protein